MKRMIVIVVATYMSLIFGGCSTVPCSPQIVKVQQKTQIKEPPLPNLKNPNEVCERGDDNCIEAAVAELYIEVVKYVAKFHESVKAYQ